MPQTDTASADGSVASEHAHDGKPVAVTPAVCSSEGSSPGRTARRDTCDPATTAMAVESAADHSTTASDGDSASGPGAPHSSSSSSSSSSPSVHAAHDAGAEAVDEPTSRGSPPTEREASVSAVPLADANMAAPREVVMTARPGEVSKRQTERRMQLASQWGVLSATDMAAEAAEAAPAEPATVEATARRTAGPTAPPSVPLYGHAPAPRRRIDWRASASPAAESQKKARHVSLLTLDRVRPIADGVNTPRSLALCEERGIDARQLAPKAESTFHSGTVSPDLARMRYESYEKRRQAHLKVLLPLYEQRYGLARGTGGASKPSPARPRASQSARVSTALGARKARPNGSRSLGASTTELNAEEAAVDRQFDQQAAALARAAAGRDTSASPQPRAGSPGYLSARTATTSVGRTAVSPSPAVMRLRSRSVAENRRLTAGEAEVLAEIEYKEHMRQERLLRAQEKAEVAQMARIEQTIGHERRTEKVVHNRAVVTEKRQYEMYNTTMRRQMEARQRRESMEVERKARLERMMEEKSARSVVHDPYASLVARQRFATPAVSRAGSPRGPNAH